MWTYKLHRHDQVPHIFFEPFITRGYRSCPSSLVSCLASSLQPNNEAVNVWTHFLPLIPFAVIIFNNVVDVPGIHDPFTWPLIAFLLSACIYMIASACAHLFNNMSIRHRYVMFFFDYCGVSMNMLGSCIAYNAYVFTPRLIAAAPLLHRVFLPGAILTSTFSTFLASASRFANGHLLHYGRLPAFMLPFFWGTIPVFCRVFLCTFDPTSAENPDAISYHVTHLIWISIAAVFYGTRFPECVFPGYFDVVGHSHQFFHVATAMCSYTQYLALKVDMATQRDFLVGAFGMPTFATSFGALLSVLIANFVIIGALSFTYFSPTSPKYMAVSSLKNK